MPQAIGFVLTVLIVAWIVSLLYQGWLWTVAWVTATGVPFLVQWWWLALVSAMALGSLQARALMRKDPFSNFANSAPVLPPDFDQPTPEEKNRKSELLRDEHKLTELLEKAPEKMIEALDAASLTTSGGVDHRSRAGKDYERYRQFIKIAPGKIKDIDRELADLEKAPKRRLAEWRSEWENYGCIQGLRDGAITGGVLGLVVYAGLLWWQGQSSVWSVVASAASFAVALGLVTIHSAEEFEDLADKVVARSREDRAANNARSINPEVDSIDSDIPRLEA